ncbi:hypothetical protein BC830DRAFT_52225 [Chytriomyces sp. MP71]|nr:hypothetical protein BC830DRAFT_52225 [Chytriomyces sp. MP71]
MHRCLQCNTVEGKYVLFKAPSVQCFSGAHSGAAAFAIIMLILLLGVLPLTLYFILSRLHKSDNITYEHDGITNIQKLFQCLYIVFKPEFYWFMPITMIEKGVTSILFTLLIKYDEKTQVNVYILFLAFLCAMRIYWQPYYSHLEAYLNREISLGILVMIAFRQYTSQNGVSTGTIAQVGIIVFLPVVMHAIRWISANYVKHQDIILEQTGKFTSKMGGSGSMIKSKSHSNSNAGIKNLNRSESKGFGGNTQMRRSVEKLVVGGSTSGSVGKSKQGLSRQTSSKLSVHDKAAGNGLCAIMSPISGTARGSIIKKQEEQQPLNTTPAP